MRRGFNMDFWVSEVWTGKRSADARWILESERRRIYLVVVYFL
jgi:hypothetical protein